MLLRDALSADLATEWKSRSSWERRHIRRLVRLGRPLSAPDAPLATAYAKVQAGRPWMRAFWLWFVPGVVVALLAAARLHPLLVGVVLALAAQAVFARRNIRQQALR